MKTVTIVRSETGDAGTFGNLSVDGHSFVTGELPDFDNAPEISNIPAGKYRCRWTFSNRLQRETYQVLDVRGRTGIRFHAANLMGDESKGLKAEVLGCIALGSARGDVAGQPGITGSKAAIKAFEDLMGRDDFELHIINEYQETGAPSTGNVG